VQALERTSVPADNGAGGGTAYTADQVVAILTGVVLTERWKFERLAADGTIGDLFVQPGAEVQHDTTRAVKRSLKFTVRGDVALTPFSDLVRVRYQAYAPDGGWLDFVLGIFTVVPPSKAIQPAATWRTYDAYDLTQLLVDGNLTAALGLAAGAPYLSSIQSVVGDYGGGTPLPVSIDLGSAASPNLVAPLGWDAGTTRLTVVNDLLGGINCFPAWIDETGTLRSRTIPDWNLITPSFTFDATVQGSIVHVSGTETIDITKAYNQVLVISDDPRRPPPLSVLYTNTRPDSPISVPNWHPKLTTVRDSTIPDIAVCLAVAMTKAQEAARIFSRLTVNTTAWPVSQDNDVYGLIYQTADEPLNAFNYLETRWTHRCKAGALTEHELVRLVAA
jgi:hypothetical protein